MKISAFDAALNVTWAMEERALETLLEVAAREVDVSPEALEAYRARNLAGADRARTRNGVATLDAIGPLFKRANLMTAISGATSYEILRGDLQAAIDDPQVHAILLNIDSPGGEASGAGELAQAVADARGQKPIVAYVGGVGASAAYWIASAADKIVVDPSARLGSIGVQVAFVEREARAGEKKYRFVSSQSPLKNPDPGTEEFNAEVQGTIDAMAQVFVEAVARNRGVATETVLKDFGKGGTFVGQMAIEAGLADSIGTFEGVLAELSAGGRKKVHPHKGVSANMDDETITAAQRDAAVAAAATTAVTEERARVAGLRNLAALGATDEDITAAIDSGSTVADFAASLANKTREAAIAAAAAVAAGKDKKIEALRKRRRDGRQGRSFGRERARREDRRRPRERNCRQRFACGRGVINNGRFQQH
jgi:signal peptide peptidase SppA